MKQATALVAVDDGAMLATRTTGPAGGLPVVLLHGGPGLWDYLQPVADLLPSGLRIHRFDQRGCGASTGHGDYRLERAIADLEALRVQWGHERWTVFGHSYGASLALAYAFSHPGRVQALIYCSGFGPGEPWRQAYRANRISRLTPQRNARLAELAATADRDQAQETEFLTLSWVTDHADLERAEAWAREDAIACPGVNYQANKTLGAQASAWTPQYVEEQCRQVAARALLLHGDGDPRPADAVQPIAAALPNGHLALIPGAGHHPWREQPAVFAATIAAFLTTTPTTSAGTPAPAEEPL